MFFYTTCRDCGGLLHTTDSDTVHPGCTPKPTNVECLAQLYRVAVEIGDTATETQLDAAIEELDARPPRLMAAALRYAAWGWPVFPLKPRAKAPATRNGFKDATTDMDRVRAWWERNPDSNIGLPTGIAFDVIDVDVPLGVVSYAQLLAEEDPRTGVGDIPDVHGHVATSSGGLHLYIPATGDGNSAGLEPGLDYRGVGGYVVAPPSTLGERGRAWSWVSVPSPTITGAAQKQAA